MCDHALALEIYSLDSFDRLRTFPIDKLSPVVLNLFSAGKLLLVADDGKCLITLFKIAFYSFLVFVTIIDLTLDTRSSDTAFNIPCRKHRFMIDFNSRLNSFLRTNIRSGCEVNVHQFIIPLITVCQIYNSSSLALAFVPPEVLDSDGQTLVQWSFETRGLVVPPPVALTPEAGDGEYLFNFFLSTDCKLSKDAPPPVSQKRPGSPLAQDHEKRARSVPPFSPEAEDGEDHPSTPGSKDPMPEADDGEYYLYHRSALAYDGFRINQHLRNGQDHPWLQIMENEQGPTLPSPGNFKTNPALPTTHHCVAPASTITTVPRLQMTASSFTFAGSNRTAPTPLEDFSSPRIKKINTNTTTGNPAVRRNIWTC